MGCRRLHPELTEGSWEHSPDLPAVCPISLGFFGVPNPSWPCTIAEMPSSIFVPTGDPYYKNSIVSKAAFHFLVRKSIRYWTPIG